MDKHDFINDYLQGKRPIEGNSWELPSAQELEKDEALFENLMAEKKAPKRIWLWPLAVAACIAGFIAIFLAPPRESNVEPETQQPVVAQQVEKQEEPVVKEEPAETKTEVEAPKPTRRAPKRKPVVQQEVIEEPLLAEAETMPEDVETEQEYLPTEPAPFLLAAAFEQDIRSRGERLHQEIAQAIKNP